MRAVSFVQAQSIKPGLEIGLDAVFLGIDRRLGAAEPGRLEPEHGIILQIIDLAAQRTAKDVAVGVSETLLPIAAIISFFIAISEAAKGLSAEFI